MADPFRGELARDAGDLIRRQAEIEQILSVANKRAREFRELLCQFLRSLKRRRPPSVKRPKAADLYKQMRDQGLSVDEARIGLGQAGFSKRQITRVTAPSKPAAAPVELRLPGRRC